MSLNYLIFLGSSVAIWTIASLGFQVMVGLVGIINLGYVALMGIGGYTYALLTHSLHINPIVSLIIACVAPIPLGLILCTLTKRVRGDYLALMTLWFSFVIVILLLNLEHITRGALGIPGIQKPNILAGDMQYFIFLIVLTSIIAYGIHTLKNSPLGIVMAAVRDDELAAQSFGKNSFRIKIIAFTFSSLIAGLSGALLAMFLQFIDPISFYLPQLILVLTFVIVGGLASVRGTIVASILLGLLPEILRFIDLSSQAEGAFRAMLYSLVLLGILLYRPKGLFGEIELE